VPPPRPSTVSQPATGKCASCEGKSRARRSDPHGVAQALGQLVDGQVVGALDDTQGRLTRAQVESSVKNQYWS
jgi:hypothetical protein